MYLRTPSRFGLRGVGLGDALVSSLASAITSVEGYNPNFAPNNNPGNLIYIGPNQNGQSGVTRGAGGFAHFTSPASGQAAMEWQIQNYIDRGYDLNTFFNTWAPPNTKNAAGGAQTSQMTTNYISRVASATGIDPSVPLKSIQGGYAGGSASDDTGVAAGGGDSSYPTPAGGADYSYPTGNPADFSAYLPGYDGSYTVGGVVLSGSDLWLLGGAIVGVVLLTSVL